MKFFKKAAIFMAATMFLTACSTPKQETSQTETEKSAQNTASQESTDISTVEKWGALMKSKYGGTEINLAFASHPSAEALKKITPEFEELTGIKVNWKLVQETQLKNDQLLDFQSNAGNYDLYMVDKFWLAEYAAKKVLYPLNDILNDPTQTPEWYDFSDVLSYFSEGLTKSGDTYLGMPLVGETRFVGYRTDLFEKYGKKPPQTMDELMELAKFFNGKEPDLYGIAMRAQKGIQCASGWMSLAYCFSDGFIDQKTGESLMNDPRVLESLNFYVDLLKNAPPDVSTYTHEEAMGAFISGSTAMWLDSTALVPVIQNPESSKIYDKVAFVPTPEGPLGRASDLGGWGISIPNTAKNKEAAWAFLMFVTSKEKAIDLYKNGGAPTRVSIFQNPELVAENPSLPSQMDALAAAYKLVERGLSWIPPHEKLGQILDIVGNYGNQALIGEITPETACEKSHTELVSLLSE